MSGPGIKRPVIFVLLDGFRHDYLMRTRFLKRTAQSGLTGRLEEPFGFCPRAAYFGGLSVSKQGFSNMFWLDPQRSAFSCAAYLARAGDEEWLRSALRPEIVRRAQARLPAFSAHYADPLQIPLRWLGLFDLAEKEAPWSPQAGYRSLFHVLDAKQTPWLEISWPFAGLPAPADDRAAIAAALGRMSSEHAFTFIHLPNLDAAGHCHGPGSVELQRILEDTDRLCESLVDHALTLHDDPVFVFAGDHGMLPVIKAVDVSAPLLGTGLRVGHDFAFFVDSTMVRCWFFSRAAAEAVHAALAGVQGGHWLGEEEKRRWEIHDCDPRNGHAIFLADPGVVFSPSFFDWSGAAVPRGMHGYAPDVPDNQAIFLAYRPRENWRGDVGIVPAKRLYPSFLSWLGLPAETYTDVPPVTVDEAQQDARRYTLCPGSAADTVVANQVSRALEEITLCAPAADAILLSGSFGRGEGTVLQEQGRSQPINDYDFVVVGSVADARRLATLGPALAGEFGIDFVDIGVLPHLERNSRISQGDFDLRYGARLLAGNPDALESLPLHAPAQIPVSEGAFQLGNRLGGMLLAASGWGNRTRSPEQFLHTQITKLLIAIADCWLIHLGDYHVSYAIRRERFTALSIPFCVATRALIDAAFAYKLEARPCDLPAPLTIAPMAAVAQLQAALGWSDDGLDFSRALGDAVATHLSPPPTWLDSVRASRLAPQRPDDGGECIHAVVASIYLATLRALIAWPQGLAARAQAIRSALPAPAGPLATDAQLPCVLAEAWLSLFH